MILTVRGLSKEQLENAEVNLRMALEVAGPKDKSVGRYKVSELRGALRAVERKLQKVTANRSNVTSL